MLSRSTIHSRCTILRRRCTTRRRWSIRRALVSRTEATIGALASAWAVT